MPAVSDLDRMGGALRHPRGVRIGAVARDHGHLRMRPEPGGDGLRQTIVEEIDRAATLEIDDDRAIGVALTFGPIVNADHAWCWSRCGLVVADAAQHGLTAARQPLPRELAGARCPTQ